MCAVDFTLFRECLAYNYRFKRRPSRLAHFRRNTLAKGTLWRLK